MSTTSCLVFSLFLVFMCCSINHGRQYDRCQLAQELHYRFKFPKEQLPTWLCIAYWEGNFNTSTFSESRFDGSKDFGMFQISDKYWCLSDTNKEYNLCNMTCDRLLDDDLTDDIQCVKEITKKQGLTSWVSYRHICYSNTNGYLEGCVLQDSLSNRQMLVATKPNFERSYDFPSHTMPTQLLPTSTPVNRNNVMLPTVQQNPVNSFNIMPPAIQPTSVNNGNVFLQQPNGMLQQPNTMLQQPNVMLQQPNTMLQQPNVMLQQPNVMLQQPNVMLQQSNVMQQQPNVMLQQPNVMLQQPNVMQQQPNVMLQQPNVMIQQPSATLHQPFPVNSNNVLLQQPSLMVQQPNVMQQQTGQVNSNSVILQQPSLMLQQPVPLNSNNVVLPAMQPGNSGIVNTHTNSVPKQPETKYEQESHIGEDIPSTPSISSSGENTASPPPSSISPQPQTETSRPVGFQFDLTPEATQINFGGPGGMTRHVKIKPFFHFIKFMET